MSHKVTGMGVWLLCVVLTAAGAFGADANSSHAGGAEAVEAVGSGPADEADANGLSAWPSAAAMARAWFKLPAAPTTGMLLDAQVDRPTSQPAESALGDLGEALLRLLGWDDQDRGSVAAISPVAPTVNTNGAARPAALAAAEVWRSDVPPFLREMHVADLHHDPIEDLAWGEDLHGQLTVVAAAVLAGLVAWCVHRRYRRPAHVVHHGRR